MECVVAKKRKNKSIQKKTESQKPWLSFHTGSWIIAGVSLIMAIITAWQVIPIKGTLQGILWGLFFGGSIWLIYLGMLLFNRLFRGS